jgi:hypothetical protein
MTCRLPITFGFVGFAAMTVAMSGAGCSGTESSDQSPVAATGGTAGQTGTSGGGTDTQGGNGGGATGGSGPTGQVGTLGQSCGTPGALACAGNYQKLTLICGADGKWAAGQTCTGNQICDTRAGVNAGSCQDQDSQCAGHGPGYKFCVQYSVYQCGRDALDYSQVADCAGPCIDGVCSDSEPCPSGSFQGVDCAHDCSPTDPACGPGVCQASSAELMPMPGWPIVVRTGGAADSCPCSDGQKWTLTIPVSAVDDYVKATVAPPWTVALSQFATGNGCTRSALGQCAVGLAPEAVEAITTDPNAGPRNITITLVNEGTTCP